MFHIEQKEEPARMSGLFFLLRNCSYYDKVENA